MVEYSLQGHTAERASQIYLVQERIGAHKPTSYYLSGTYQLSMNCGKEPTLSDHCPKGHKAPPLLLLHERPLPALFRLLHLEWTIPFMLFHTIAKNVYVYDFSREECFWCQKKPPSWGSPASLCHLKLQCFQFILINCACVKHMRGASQFQLEPQSPLQIKTSPFQGFPLLLPSACWIILIL